MKRCPECGSEREEDGQCSCPPYAREQEVFPPGYFDELAPREGGPGKEHYPRCNEFPNCTHPRLNGSAFCKDHGGK